MSISIPGGYSTAFAGSYPDMTSTINPNDVLLENQSLNSPRSVPHYHRPNYNQLHALPIPLTIHPFPALIPHNPLSILHLAYTYISQILRPPCSHPPTLYSAYFSVETLSVHVTNARDIRALWEKGFFGKGSLSRSEPSWLDREKRKRGLLVSETSEEVTRRRREERKTFKNERARKERDAIEDKLRQEGKGTLTSNGPLSASPDAATAASGNLLTSTHGDISTGNQTAPCDIDGATSGTSTAVATECASLGSEGPAVAVPSNSSEAVRFILKNKADTKSRGAANATQSDTITQYENSDVEIQDQEHLQLTLEEAFFLVYGLGVLEIIDQDTETVIPIPNLLSLFRRHSYFPPCPLLNMRPDDPFLVSYVTYHHFRSLGWVVRPGVKFAVHYLLYNRGPVFSHAEFAVMIIPSYSHPYWKETCARTKETQKKESKSWWWLHCVNRVQSQVRKSLLLAYVEVPPPGDHIPNPLDAHGGKQEADLDKWMYG